MIGPAPALALLFLCVSLVLAMPARADDDYDAGGAAFEVGDYDTARELWTVSAAAGDPRAAAALGEIYLRGMGVDADPAQAGAWFRKAAEQDEPHALHMLGVLMAEGQGMPRDEASAAELLLSAAAAGQIGANYALGVLYEEGRGVPPNAAEAARHYQIAAEAGNPSAQYALGLLYIAGKGVPQDYERAAALFLAGAEAGDINAQIGLARLYRAGLGVPQDQTEEARWYRRAAIQGDDEAKRELTELSPEAQAEVRKAEASIPQPAAESVDDVTAEKAPDRANPESLRPQPPEADMPADAEQAFLLAMRHARGIEAEQDTARAMALLRHSALMGYAPAQLQYGLQLGEGRGAARDPEAATGWIRKAAEQGRRLACQGGQTGSPGRAVQPGATLPFGPGRAGRPGRSQRPV
jgi:TPR repeat protein